MGVGGVTALAVRLCSGAIFLAFGLGKFVAYDDELAAFERYGVPWPEAFTYAVGAIEITGGALLLCGWLIRPAALVLAGNMIGAIAVSGIGEGETISLTLAPALLVAMLVLVRIDPQRARRASPT